MPRKKDLFKHGGHIPRIRENSRLIHTHESIVDVINRRHPGNSFLDALGFDFFRSFGGNLHNDIIYSDDDDDDDDDLFFLPNATRRPLQPHPRIRQLTDEEAEKHAKELIAEEERRKEKTERNKRKKLRKKEKKRLEKENAVKVLPEEEQGKSDSSDNQDETPIIESNTEANECPKSSKTHNAAETAGCDESSGNNTNETVVETKKKEDVEQKDLDLNNSYASAAKSVPEETCNQEPAIERKEEKGKLLDVQQPKEVKLNIVEKPEVPKKEEEKPETNKEKPVDLTAEDYAKRSRELANIGNHLAACGQYEMAVKCFTDAIKFNPKEFKLFGNRSLCYERMQQYENALRDADLALCMEPNWIKGLFRKGKALCGLKKYYEASLIYKEVLKLDSLSAEAIRELKRAQTLHLMEMGFTWAQSSEALKTHATLEQAIEALFGGDSNPGPGDASASRERHNVDQPVMQDEDEGEWTLLQTSRPRTQQVRESDALDHSRSKSISPTPHSRNFGKPPFEKEGLQREGCSINGQRSCADRIMKRASEDQCHLFPLENDQHLLVSLFLYELELFPIWVGSLSPSVTYPTLHDLFSRVGVVYSIKMLLEQQCAFVNYVRKEDCDRAIQCFNGMVVEGAPLSVRYPIKIHSGLGVSKSAATDLRHSSYKKECFFWRTTGCTRQDCTYRHVPEHKNIDKDKFTSRLGQFNM